MTKGWSERGGNGEKYDSNIRSFDLQKGRGKLLAREGNIARQKSYKINERRQSLIIKGDLLTRSF